MIYSGISIFLIRVFHFVTYCHKAPNLCVKLYSLKLGLGDGLIDTKLVFGFYASCMNKIAFFMGK